MNTVNIIGRIANDLELRTVGEDRKVINFTVAVSRKFAKDKTDFIPCQAWGKTAEFVANYCGKGTLVGVVGALTIDTYTDKEGKRASKTYVNADSVDKYSSPKEVSAPDKKIDDDITDEMATMTDELPFEV